jgi:hypothetical protein
MKILSGHFFGMQVIRWSFVVLNKIGCFLVSWESWARQPDWMAARNAKTIRKKEIGWPKKGGEVEKTESDFSPSFHSFG